MKISIQDCVMEFEAKLKKESNLLMGMTILGLLVRTRGIINRSLWWDEFVSIDFALMDFPGEIITAIYKNVNPPLFYLILSVWMKVFSQHDVVLRILPFIFAVATIPVFYLVIRKILGVNIALLSTLFLALNPFHVFYSIEVRMYSMTVFCVVASLWFFHAWLENPTWRNSAGLILVNITGLYLHYFYILIFIGEGIYFSVTVLKHRSLIRGWIMIQCITLLLYIPWVPAMVYQYNGPVYGHFKVLNWSQFVELCLQIAPGACMMHGNPEIITTLIVYALVLLGVITICARIIKGGHIAPLSILIYFFIPIIIVWLQSYSKPSYTQRNMIVIVPFFLALIATGVFKLPGKHLKSFVSAVLVIVSIISIWYLNDWSRDSHLRGDWKKAATILKQNFKDEDILFLYPGELQSWGINYYCPDIKHVPHVFEPVLKTDKLESPETLLKKIDKLQQPNTTVWFIVCGYKEYNHWKNIVPVLDQNLIRTHFEHLYNVMIYRYTPKIP